MKTGESMDFSGRIIADIRKRSYNGIGFYPLLVFVTLYTDDFYRRHTDIAIPFGAMIAGICLFRLVHLTVFRWAKEFDERLNTYAFFTSMGLTSLIWGVWFAIVMGLQGEHNTKLLMAICTIGLCAGGSVAFVPSVRLAIFFNISMLVPAIVHIFIHKVNLPMATFTLIFCVYLTLLAYRSNREYRQALDNEQELLKKSEALVRLSRLDGLTSLFNRRYFNERFEQEWKQATRLSSPLTLMIADIDHFKRINDRYGHQAGDEYLKLTADIFKEVFKRGTDLVARYGGEEFVILLPNTDTDTAIRMAETLRQRMADICLVHQKRRITATISIGIATTTPLPHAAADRLIAKADNALYKAKHKGRNRAVVFSSSPAIAEADRSG
ncbi:hypothetical protein DSCO28_13050 [Desulfosarcina ovata subsp. sediminis]|uniref:diguanylate cyclase n=1 Tax=Desulfosarcina ovata subsp. sediminis TaxID=885957 RepID=A0A5K7ZM43_9BACT|nr:GGDEF domain-containing protein [Desulfosarcina ovata]BBO80739.1 hypothetical protein DSCO28_13050 [Desulfosarcina ovata subsp. sediminis]